MKIDLKTASQHKTQGPKATKPKAAEARQKNKSQDQGGIKLRRFQFSQATF